MVEEQGNMLVNILQVDFEFEDERGHLVQLVHSGYQQVNVVFSRRNSVRGDHMHKENKELFYVISGAFTLKVQKGEHMETYKFHGGDFFEIQPFVMHSFQYVEDTLLVSMYSKGVELPDGNKDIYAEG